MHTKNISKKYLALLLAVFSPTATMASTKTWDSVLFKDTVEREDYTSSVEDLIVNKILLRQQSSAEKGMATKTTPPEPVYNTKSEATSYIEGKYPGLFKIGTKPVSPHVIKNDKYTNKYSEQFGVDPAIMRALMSQECYSGQDTTGAAWGPAQIENTLKSEFAAFGKKYFNKEFKITEDVNTDDRLNPEYSIAFACYRFSQDLEYYDGDYVKALQAYNFSKYSLDTLLKAFPTGNTWLDKRGDIAYYNGVYKRTGKTSYGDKIYVENVLKFYNP